MALTRSEAEDLAKTHLDITREMYVGMGYNEMNPTLHIRKEGEKDVAVVMYGVPPGYLFECVQQVVKSVPWKPDSIVVMMDAFHKKLDKDDAAGIADVMDGRHEPLAIRFARGEPGVTEAISAIVMTEDQHVMARQIYKYTPVDGWEWGEVEVDAYTDKPGTESDWDWDALVNGMPRVPLSARKEMQ